jgi:GcrA cell cycle regulator
MSHAGLTFVSLNPIWRACAKQPVNKERQDMSWTDERIGQLREMWEKGMTASQIADELGGVSRNAVIGKAHRLGLQARPSPVKAGEVQPKAEPVAKKVKSVPAAVPVAPPPVREAAPPPESSPLPSNNASLASSATAPTPADAPASSPDFVTPQPVMPRIVSVGPGGFLRQGPGDQQQPIPPAPPRRLVPAKPSAEIADKTSLLDLNEKICKWPMGHPGEPDFHFCGDKVNPGFPYCVEHCGRAYQAQLPRGARRPPPPLPYGGPRVR